MEYNHTFTFTTQFSDETMELLNDISKASKHIVMVERSYGFVEIHKEEDVEYTTMDILNKGL